LRYIDSSAFNDASDKTTQRIREFVDNGSVEQIKTMWRRYLHPQLLERDEDLPFYATATMKVILI